MPFAVGEIARELVVITAWPVDQEHAEARPVQMFGGVERVLLRAAHLQLGDDVRDGDQTGGHSASPTTRLAMLVSYSPETNALFSITRRWKARFDLMPSTTNSLSALR